MIFWQKISGYANGVSVVAQVFDGLRGWFRLGSKTVDCYRYGVKHAYVRAFAASSAHHSLTASNSKTSKTL